MERRLGRGLESLLGGGSAGGTEAAPDLESGLRVLPVEQIRPNPNQPRKVFDADLLRELGDSIREHGLLQPICVRRSSAGGGYEIVAGERRWRAARLGGLGEIPAVILEEVDDRGMVELALVENLQRQDLDPMEKARAFRELVGLGLTQQQVAERVGLKRSTVTNHLRLLDLPREVQEAVVMGVVSMGHARAFLGLGDPEAIRRLLARTVGEDLSVRQVERLVRGEGEGQATPGASRGGVTAPSPAPWVKEMEGGMRRHLGTQVTIHDGPGYRGKIVIHYHDRGELDRLCEQLAPRDEL